MRRRNFLKSAPLAGAVVSQADFSFSFSDDRFELNEVTIDELQQRMNTGALSSRTLTKLYLDRINKIDKKGPGLNAIIELNPEAIAIARQMDEERKEGRVRSLLHGIPVLIKDNIDTGDKMMTTAGSLALLHHRAKHDAPIIKKLRDAGAVIIGKTNCSEWANFRSSNSSSGWSSRGGQTKNACVLDRTPSGSSSGSAVAVAANMCAIAVGTETDGSIVAASSTNGIVGIKPTVGLWNGEGIIPISKTQDTAGPMARTVRDAAIMLGIVAASPTDYTIYLDKDALKGARIGVEKSHLEGRADVTELYKNAIALMKEQGAEIVEVDLLKMYQEKDYKEFTILKYEFKDGLNRYLAQANAPVKSLDDVIAFNKKNETTAMPFFKQELLESSNALGSLSDTEYINAISKRPLIQKMIIDLMTGHGLSVICGVSIGLPCMIDVVNGDYPTGYYFCPPAAVTGFPHATVPMGKVHELPAGLSFMSPAYAERDVIRIAYAYEQVSRKREAPKFIRSSIP